LLNFLTQQDDTLLFIVSVQQDLCAAGNLQRRVPVPQQFAQEDLIAWFQDEVVRLATAHGSSPSCASGGWPTLAYAVKSGKQFIAEFRHQGTSKVPVIHLGAP
jgi:hypothetical protein